MSVSSPLFSAFYAVSARRVSLSVKAIISGQPTASGVHSLSNRGVATALVVLLNTALIGGIIIAVVAIVSVTSATGFGINSLR